MPILHTRSGATIHYLDEGAGPPVLALHGAYSTLTEVKGFLAPALAGRRGIYVDLPGMGESTARGIRNASDTVAALAQLVDEVLGDRPFAVVGHSFGAHLARGLAALRPDQVSGLALICPMVPDDLQPEPPAVVLDDGTSAQLPQWQRQEFDAYFVVHTADTVARFTAAVVPALGHYDAAAVERVLDGALDPAPETVGYDRPVLVIVGRHDSFVGYQQYRGLLDGYPGATAMVLADAGHALAHEQPELLAAALAKWLRRVDMAR